MAIELVLDVLLSDVGGQPAHVQCCDGCVLWGYQLGHLVQLPQHLLSDWVIHTIVPADTGGLLLDRCLRSCRARPSSQEDGAMVVLL